MNPEEEADLVERHTGASLERCAEAFAAIRQFPAPLRTEILQRFELDQERFASALEGHSGAIAKSLAKEDPTLLMRFARAYGTTDRRIREERPRVKDLHPVLVAPRPAHPASDRPRAGVEGMVGADAFPPAVTSVEPSRPVQASPTGLPSYLKVESEPRAGFAVPLASSSMPHPAARPMSALAGTSLALDVPLSPALPFQSPSKGEASMGPMGPRGPSGPAAAGVATALASRTQEARSLTAEPTSTVGAARTNPLGGTSLVVDVPIGPSLPFLVGPRGSDNAAASPPNPAMVTAARPASSLAPPRDKRLLRFDPQTGEPLAAPRWEDVPAAEPSAGEKGVDAPRRPVEPRRPG